MYYPSDDYLSLPEVERLQYTTTYFGMSHEEALESGLFEDDKLLRTSGEELELPSSNILEDVPNPPEEESQVLCEDYLAQEIERAYNDFQGLKAISDPVDFEMVLRADSASEIFHAKLKVSILWTLIPLGYVGIPLLILYSNSAPLDDLIMTTFLHLTMSLLTSTLYHSDDKSVFKSLALGPLWSLYILLGLNLGVRFLFGNLGGKLKALKEFNAQLIQDEL